MKSNVIGFWSFVFIGIGLILLDKFIYPGIFAGVLDCSKSIAMFAVFYFVYRVCFGKR